MSITEKLEGLNLILGLIAIIVGSTVAGTWFVFELRSDVKDLRGESEKLAESVYSQKQMIEDLSAKLISRGGKGAKGEPGERGKVGPQGPKGTAGKIGPAGPPGQSVSKAEIKTIISESVATFLGSDRRQNKAVAYKSLRSLEPITYREGDLEPFAANSAFSFLVVDAYSRSCKFRITPPDALKGYSHSVSLGERVDLGDYGFPGLSLELIRSYKEIPTDNVISNIGNHCIFKFH